MSGPTGSRPSQLKAPSKLAKPTAGIPRSTTTSSSGSGLQVPRSSSNLITTPSSSVILTENTDDFIIGDRVWVGGNKPGHIQYIGETQFAPGEWAGVVLEEPIGKNDGSLAGVRYFQCEPKRGVFSRLTKLTKEPLLSLMRDEDDSASVKANGSIRSTSPRPGSASGRLAQTRSSTPSSLSGVNDASKLRVNDRVQVASASGTKLGTLRYLGTTDFAAGDWAGVELDDANGKNDGSVAGKKYFSCTQKYGLFAPIHKVAKAGASQGSARRPMSSTLSSMTAATMPRRSTTTPRRAGSQESISTIGSTSSAARATKTRLGINSLTTAATKPSRSSATNMTATQTAMQEALKEKEQHIEQLLRERDLERSEVARGASQVEEVEQELTALRNEHQRYKDEVEHNVAMYKEIAEVADRRRKELENQLDEERKKLEDMAFRLEEESISLSEIEKRKKVSEASRETDLEQIASLEEALAIEKKRAENLEQECNAQFQREEALAKCRDEIERLENGLQDAERNVEVLRNEKSSASVKIQELTGELVAKISRVTELEETLNTNEEKGSKLNEGQAQLEKQLKENNLNLEKQEEKIEELNSKLLASECTIKTINQQIGELNITCADLKRKLQSSEDRCEQLVQQKGKLECDIADQMKSSGSSSEQVSQMNEQLREKEKLLESVQLELQTTNQERLRLADILEQKNAAQKQIEETLGQSRQCMVALEKKLLDSQNEWQATMEALKSELSKKSDDLASVARSSETETTQLRTNLEEHRQRVSVLDAQIDDLKKNIENTSRSNEEARATFEQKLMDARQEVELLQGERLQFEQNLQSLENEKASLAEHVQKLQQEKQESSSAVVEKERNIAVLNREVDLLKTEWSNHHAELQRKLAENKLEEENAHSIMRSHMESIQKDMEEQQLKLKETCEERDKWQIEASQSVVLIQRAKELEENIRHLQEQLEETKRQEITQKSTMEHEKEALQKMLEATKTMLDQREAELRQNQDEMDSLKQKIASVIDTKDRLDALQQENVKYVQKTAALNSRILVLEEQLTTKHTTNGDATMDSLSLEQKYSDEKETLVYQVDFLNGVIVDMHKKNDELQARLDILEVGGDLLNETSDVNLNDIKTMVAPRLFCDICEAFDLHDTEDCPTQASSGSPPATQYHGARRVERPYCDTCEVFGHWSNECDTNETF